MTDCYHEVDDFNKMIFLHKRSEEVCVPDEIELEIIKMKKKKYTLCTYIYGTKDPFEIIKGIMLNHI